MEHQDDMQLVLAAEDFDPADFDAAHKFSISDEAIIKRLIAHGPVLLRGGRGAGKSALMIASSRRLFPKNTESPALGVYLSLRNLPLLRSSGIEYEKIFLQLLVDHIFKTFPDFKATAGSVEPTLNQIKQLLGDLTSFYGKRLVLLFDDAAHIGREASLQEFFDLFRTLSSSSVSCKATIYPGVTRFGTRFDVYNDATTIDLFRNETSANYEQFFHSVFTTRYPVFEKNLTYTSGLNAENVSGFLARCVLGNMRGFIFAANKLGEIGEKGNIDLPKLTEILKNLSENYYWPLLEELRPKLGVYEPMLDPAQDIANVLFQDAANPQKRTTARMATGDMHESSIPDAANPSVLIFKDIVGKLAKPLELLEYAGFLSRREASKAMKSGGRGVRYQLNLCNLLEKVKGARLTQDIFASWSDSSSVIEPIEFHKGSKLADFAMPEPSDKLELGVLALDIDKLKRSTAYPYGLTEQKIEVLKRAGLNTIGQLADATDEQLKKIDSIGDVMTVRIKNVVGQAIWM